jgi:hypothetical protein
MGGAMAKTFMEMSAEMVTAMVTRGLLRVERTKNEDWKEYNQRAVKTVGWAMLEMYKEVSRVPGRAYKELDERGEKDAARRAKSNIITVGR